MAADQHQIIDVVTKSVEFRQTLVTLLFGVTGFALAQSWPHRMSHPQRSALRRLLPCMIAGALALLMMLYEQRRLAEAVSEESFTAYSVHWLNIGEPVLDVLIVSMAFVLFYGLR